MTTGTSKVIDLKEEREMIRRTLSATFMSEKNWQVISAEWFMAWKEYVDFENSQMLPLLDKERESLYPGPIDNSSLAGEYEVMLKQGLVEGRDYFLLPYNTAEILYQRYQGGPRYLRSVVNMGTVENSLYQIEVYPIVLAVYDCNKIHPKVLPEDKPHYITVSKKDDILKFAENYRSQYLKKYIGGLRCWVKIEEETTSPFLNNGRTNTANKERKLTVDITDKDGPWFYMRQTRGIYFADLLGEKLNQALEIIAEYCDASFYNTYDSSPRASFLNKWKENLRVGDVVDAMDKMGAWLEASVVQVYPNESVDVHFKGWSKNFDENISKADITMKVQPLYSKSKNWRDSLSEGDEVELNTGALAGKAAFWEIGTVMERDVGGGRVRVRVVNKPDIAMAIPVLSDDLKKLRAIPSHALSVEGAAHMDVDCDVLSSSRSDNINGDVWMDLDGELICRLETHLRNRSPRIVTSTATATTLTKSGSKDLGTEIISGDGLSAGRFRSTSDENEDGDKNIQGRPVVRGAVGLQNLGNTCFMNSVLQCLSNTQPLTQYFLEGRHFDDLNRSNVLGHGGKVALAYAKLIKDLWCDGYTKVIPRAFKRTIGEFQPQFAGYQQQDSQELMGFLLDGLHEDLNRCKTKPAVSKIESNGRPDDLVAREAWRRFLLRNDSVAVDRVYGLLKSHVTCKCGRESVTFDPFNTLSLPIPVRSAKPLTIVVRLLPLGSPPLKVVIEVEPTDLMKDVSRKLIERLVNLGRLPALAITATNSANDLSPSPSTPATDDSDDSDYVKVHRPTLADVGCARKTNDDFPGTGAYSKAAYIQRIAAQKRMQYVTDGQPQPYLPPLTLHMASMWSHNPSRIAKVHLADNATANDFIGGRDTLVAFQLEHPAPVKLTSTYSSAQNRTHSNFYSSSSSSPVPAETKEEPYVVAVDMYIGKAKKELSPYNSIDTYGTPHRFVITKETTGKELMALVWAQVYRYVKQGSESKFNSDNVPFVLNISNTWASGLKGPIQATDEVVDISGDQVVVVCWKDEADNDEHFDKIEFQRCVTLPLDGDTNQDRDDIGNSDDKMEVENNGVENTTRSSSGGSVKKSALSVYTCLDKFCEREQLNEEETLYCSGCKQHVAPVKKLDLYATPDILIIQLKRFQYIPGQYFVHREKINDFVDFPLTGLDLRKYVRGQGGDNENSPPVYDLYAVSLHSGGLGGGHYTAVCKSQENSKWYNFNDSTVSETSPESAVCEQSYVLFYRRQRGSLRWAGLTPLPDPGLPDEA